MNKDKIPQGYKNSPLGIIPESWDVKKFGDIAQLSKEKYVPNDNEIIQCLELEHFEQGTGKILGWINSSEQKSTKNRFEKGDVLFGKLRPYLQKYWYAYFDGVCSSEVWVLKSKSKKCTTSFLYRIIQSNRFIQAANISSGSKMPRADWDYVSTCPFLLPTLPEQHKIAEILICWDETIEKQTQLIKKLEIRKRGLMQQLLTGKKRIGGFDKETNYKQLKTYIQEVTNRNRNQQIETILSVTNKDGFIKQNEQFERVVASNDLSNYKIVKKGQFAYNPSRVNVGSLDLLKSYEEGILSPMYVVFETDKNQLLPEFLLYHLKTDWFIGHIPMFVQGSVRDSLSFQGLSSMKFFIPLIEEQIAIVNILSTADSEIQTEKEKLIAFKSQKKELMQQLLTGKKRVKI